MVPNFKIPVEYKRLFDDDWREAAIYGGRYSMKSHSVARYILTRVIAKKTRVACFREFQNSIKESSHQLFKDLIDEYNLNSEFTITDNAIINTRNGSDFIFKGLHHNEQSVKSIEGIDLAWVEEAQTVSKPSIEVLTPTVRKEGSKIIYTYNRLLEADPVHQRLVIEGRPNTLVLNVNYHVAIKNNIMPDIIRLEMEDDKARRPHVYNHKWLGEPMSMELRIYKDWEIIDDIPHEARLERHCLDFGYTNDPTAIIDIYYYNGGYILDEVCYQKGMLNNAIADILKNLTPAVTKADSAEPKSIDELRLYGLTVLPATKGPGSVSAGIQTVQQLRISVTRRSPNIIREYANYLFAVDKDGRTLNIPADHQEDHTMDAIRYGMEGVMTLPKKKTTVVRRTGGDSYTGYGSRRIVKDSIFN
jgi:phage terminase large subunit